jgi:hypothetical protein
MELIASEYRSRRKRDSITINSANILTRSPSFDAAASLSAKDLCRAIACCAKRSDGVGRDFVDCLEFGRDGLNGAGTTTSLLGMCSICDTGRGDSESLDCGGGVGSDFGGTAGESPM